MATAERANLRVCWRFGGNGAKYVEEASKAHEKHRKAMQVGKMTIRNPAWPLTPHEIPAPEATMLGATRGAQAIEILLGWLRISMSSAARRTPGAKRWNAHVTTSRSQASCYLNLVIGY